MPDFHSLEGTIPVAPLNLIVMESAKELGESVNKYISQFRHELYKMPENDPAFHGYVKDNYKISYNLDRFGSGEAKATSRSRFVEMMFTFLQMSATTVSPTKCITTSTTNLPTIIIRI